MKVNTRNRFMKKLSQTRLYHIVNNEIFIYIVFVLKKNEK